MKCILCKKDKRIGQRFYYGFICKDCKKSLPNLFALKNLTEEQVFWLNSRKYEMRKTAELGIFSIDESHALIGVKKGREVNVFSLLDMSEISLVCTHIRRKGNSNMYVCNIELTFRLNCNLSYKGTIKYNEPCEVVTEAMKRTLSVTEPAILCLLRDILNKSIKIQYSDSKLILERLSELESKKEILAAKSTLMLPDVFTEEELKDHRNSLLKAFHPDNNSDPNSNDFTFKINTAYKVLRRLFDEE